MARGKSFQVTAARGGRRIVTTIVAVPARPPAPPSDSSESGFSAPDSASIAASAGTFPRAPTPASSASKKAAAVQKDKPAAGASQKKAPSTRPARPERPVHISAGALRGQPLTVGGEYKACIPHPLLRPDLSNGVYSLEWAPLLVLAFPPDIAFKGGVILTELWVAREFLPAPLYEKLGKVLRAALVADEPPTWRYADSDDDVKATVSELWDRIRGIQFSDIDYMCRRRGFRVVYGNRRVKTPFRRLTRIAQEFTWVIQGEDMSDWSRPGWRVAHTGRYMRGKAKDRCEGSIEGIGIAGVAILHLLKMGALCALMCPVPDEGWANLCIMDPLHVVRVERQWGSVVVSRGEPGPSRLRGDFNVARSTVYTAAGGDLIFVAGENGVSAQDAAEAHVDAHLEKVAKYRLINAVPYHIFVGSASECARNYFDGVTNAFRPMRRSNPPDYRGPLMKDIWHLTTALELMLRNAAPDTAGPTDPERGVHPIRSAFTEIYHTPMTFTVTAPAPPSDDSRDFTSAEMEELLASDDPDAILRDGFVRRTPAPVAVRDVQHQTATPRHAPGRRNSSPASFRPPLGDASVVTTAPVSAVMPPAPDVSPPAPDVAEPIATRNPLVKMRAVARKYSKPAVTADEAGHEGSLHGSTPSISYTPSYTPPDDSPVATTPATTSPEETVPSTPMHEHAQSWSRHPLLAPVSPPSIKVTPPSPTLSVTVLDTGPQGNVSDTSDTDSICTSPSKGGDDRGGSRSIACIVI